MSKVFVPTLSRPHLLVAVTSVLLSPVSGLGAQSARVFEDVRSIRTYPFSEPNPVPILTRDERLYPYHSFEGYAKDGVPRDWKVVTLENDLIEVFVLPEVGGKVWGAVVKSTGHEFIYRNEVMKFRNIALRGPWTSGGIEFNFGVIGHTPSTATPVDYVLRENPDGSVSCIVGAMDLPSRTHWRVEIRLPPDKAYFETNVLWYNPTVLEQPYYNWMTAAAFAREDLVMAIPGNAFLEHSGARRDWPTNAAGRYLPEYADNTFGGHKSYHVVGELNDFFGGYYRDDGYGFGHWARYEEMPGQKLWLWALSRQGGVWEGLLTDTDGQYVEYQAGRMFVQYAPGDHVNPIAQAGFEPGASDRWSETWFPLEGIGGLTDASRDGAMHVRHEGDTLTVSVNAFSSVTDTLRITATGETVASVPLTFEPVEPVERSFDLPAGVSYRVELRQLGLDYSSDPTGRTLARPLTMDPQARPSLSPADRDVFEARELVKARRYRAARELFEKAIAREPWLREALLGMADLEYRRGRFGAGLVHARRALQLNAYDAPANFVAGNLYRALGRTADARGAFGWAARSMAFRSVAYVQLAEIAMAAGDPSEAQRYARLAIDYDRHNLPARQVLAVVARRTADVDLGSAMREQMLATDPLHHFIRAEEYLAHPSVVSAEALRAALRGEYPDQVLLELAMDYHRRGSAADARAILGLADEANPIAGAWRAWLGGDTAALDNGADLSFAFPFRRETVPVLQWVVDNTNHWSWPYLLALNLWARDREDEAADLMTDLADRPDYAPALVARARLLHRDPEPDLRRAVDLAGSDRTILIELVRHLQDTGQWREALQASAAGRRRFTKDFNLDLLHARSLMNLGRSAGAVEIMDATEVLPSENARESHRLYEQAHMLAALDALERGQQRSAREHALAALEWPERLGQGRPYEPEERLARFVLGLAELAAEDTASARAAFDTVANANANGARRGASRLDFLEIAAAYRVDAIGLASGGFGEETDVGRLYFAMVREAASGRDPGRFVSRVADQYREVFGDLEGRLLLRALVFSR